MMKFARQKKIIARALKWTGGIAVVLLAAAFYYQEDMRTAYLNHFDRTGYEVDGERIYISGELTKRTPRMLKKVIRQNPQVTTLILTNVPGSLDDESLLPFAEWVRDQKLNTHLKSNSKIASGAVDLFLAGVERTMERGAKIGVHSWSDGDTEATDYPRSHKKHDLYEDYVESMLGSVEFYWFTITASPAESIHWMSETEIRRFGLLTN